MVNTATKKSTMLSLLYFVLKQKTKSFSYPKIEFFQVVTSDVDTADPIKIDEVKTKNLSSCFLDKFLFILMMMLGC